MSHLSKLYRRINKLDSMTPTTPADEVEARLIPCRYKDYSGYKEICEGIAVTFRQDVPLCAACAERNLKASQEYDRQSDAFFKSQPMPISCADCKRNIATLKSAGFDSVENLLRGHAASQAIIAARDAEIARLREQEECASAVAAQLKAEVDRLGKVLLVLDASMDGHSMSAEGMYLLHAETRHHDTGDLCIGSIRAIDAAIAAKSQP